MASAGKKPSKGAKVAKRMGTPNPQTTTRGLVSSASFSTYRNQAQAVTQPSWQGGLPTDKPYPDMERVGPNAPNTNIIGAPGTAFFGGIIQTDEYNPDFYWRDGTTIYETMLRSEPQINAIRSMIELPIRRAKYFVQPASTDAKDVEIASFIESCLFHDMSYVTDTGHTVTQQWDDILRHALLMLWFGFTGFEVVWKVEDGWTKWAQWVPLLPRTFWRWWINDANELEGIQQWTFKDYNYLFTNIPVDKLLLFTHRKEGQNYEGISLLRTAYKPWYYKTQMEKIEAIGIERNAVTPPIVYLPENFTAADQQAALTVAQNLRVNELMGVTLPGTWRVEYPKNMEKYAEATQPAIQYHDVMIARNVLAQMINLGSTETGSYSQDRSQKLTFLASIQAYADYICQVITDNAIHRLVDYNFDGVDVYPKLMCSKIVSQDIEIISDAVKSMTQGQTPVIHYSPELEEFLGEMLGIPVNPQSEITTTDPTSPNTPQQPDKANPDTEPTQQEKGTKDDTGGPITNAEVHYLTEAFQAIDAVEKGLLFYSPGQPRDYHGRWTNGGFGGPEHGGGHIGTRGSGRHGIEGVTRVSRSSGGSGGGGGHGGEHSTEHAPKATKASGKGKTAAQRTEELHATAHRLQQKQGLREEKPPLKPGEQLELRHPQDSMGRGLREVDPHYYVRAFDEDQLGRALYDHSATSLRTVAKTLGIPHTGLDHDQLVSAITSHVTEGRYSADFRGHTAETFSRSAKGSKASTPKDTISRAEHERAIAKLQSQHEAAMAKMQKQIDALKAGKTAAKAPKDPTIRQERELRQGAEIARNRAGMEESHGYPGAGKEHGPQMVAELRRQADEMERQANELKAARTQAKAARGSAAKGKGEESLGPQRLIPMRSAADVTIGRDDRPSAYVLHKIYGSLQLHNALHEYSLTTLKDMAREVQSRHPGTKPKSMSSKAEMLKYIEQHVREDDGHIGPKTQAELDALGGGQP